jgi:UDP-N-acetyl-alpha-D-muramoyl-L-alanyl-L-glutamate epimerase
MFTIHAPRLVSAQEALFSYTCSVFGVFEERLFFPQAADVGRPLAEQQALLNLTAALLGVSYYKAAASPDIGVEPLLGPAARAAVQACYSEGLGEFLFRNALPYPPRQHWHWMDRGAVAAPAASASSGRAIMAFGGGKDSHAAMALMNAAQLAYEPVSVILDERVGSRLQTMIGEKLTLIRRTISPEIIRLAREKRGHNGHVPITAINSAILTLYAALSHADAVIFANERGASKPTILHDGHPINHQYSKSIAFEGLMRAALAETAGDQPQWFSLLRPFSELWIAETVAKRAAAAHDRFTSCNRNFVFAGKQVLAEGERWCGTCPKCVFTALIFAPHCDDAGMARVFGKDVLNDAGNVEMARDLAGLGAMKPWECVGDVDDTAAAIAVLAADPRHNGKAVVAALAPELDARYGLQALRQRFATELQVRGPHFVPKPWARLIETA